MENLRKVSQPSSVEIYSKIQQAQPSHYAKLIHKQVGFMVHVQLEKVYKMANCVDSEKTNSQLYKKFAKDFIENVKKNMDQLIICCGIEERPRMETSIGLMKNPGIFMIAGIGLLDEKYQQSHTKFDIEVSFMEYIDGKFYDLISYTQQPLKYVKKGEIMNFGETYIKITTFNNFLKLLKIALFNNKQRDIKTDTNKPEDEKIKSSLIMTFTINKYFDNKQNKVQTQKTTLIDLAENVHDSTNSQKGIWDYFMIELNNLTYKKKMHYHLVSPNPLLCLMKGYLKNGKTIILPSLSSNPDRFVENYNFIQELQDIAGMIPPNPGKKGNEGLGEVGDVGKIHDEILKLQEKIKNQKYCSLREYREMKDKYAKIIDECVKWGRKYRQFFCKQFQNKRRIKLSQYQLTSDQLLLIGSCVKSDHYKDFYSSKSYISLSRQISMKTEVIKENLKSLNKQKLRIKNKFIEMLSKQNQNLQLFHSEANEKNEKNSMKSISFKIFEFFERIFYSILFYDQRSLTDEIIREEFINEQIEALCGILIGFKEVILEMGKRGEINIDAEEMNRDAHLRILLREVKNIVSEELKYKKSNAYGRQKTDKMSTVHVQKSGKKFFRLPVIEKCNSITITGNFNISDILLDPGADK